MPANLVSGIDLDMLYPKFRDQVLNLIAECKQAGAEYRLTSGYRSYAEQMNLWAQGRTKPGNKVTNAVGGQSAHNFGIAVDCARVIAGKVSWVPDDYEKLGAEAAILGLHWGKAYKDVPHVSLPGYVTATDLKPLDKLYQETPGMPLDKLKRIWEFLDNGR